MKKYLIVVSILFVCNCVPAAAPVPKAPNEPGFVRDGFVLAGIDGQVYNSDRLEDPNLTGQWFFAPFESSSDGVGMLKSDAPIAILPSSVLEKLLSSRVEDVDADGGIGSFRIWGKLTASAGLNHVYLSYFIPIAERIVVEGPSINEPNISEIIPEDVMAMLRPKRQINLAELKTPTATDSDGVIPDGLGFLCKADDGYYFEFDALGRNIDPRTFKVLPSSILDIMLRKQEISSIKIRYRISAVLTRFKGQNYLLLSRATVAHNHGNFAR